MHGPTTRPGESAASFARALAWVVLGLALLAGAAVAIAPELVGGGGRALGAALAGAGAAGVPGLAVLVALALRDRRRPDGQGR